MAVENTRITVVGVVVQAEVSRVNPLRILVPQVAATEAHRLRVVPVEQPIQMERTEA